MVGGDDFRDSFNLMINNPIYSIIVSFCSSLVSTGYFIINNQFSSEFLQENIFLFIFVILFVSIFIPLFVTYIIILLFYIIYYSNRIFLDKKQSTIMLKDNITSHHVQMHKGVYFIFSTKEYFLNLKIIKGRRFHGQIKFVVDCSDYLDFSIVPTNKNLIDFERTTDGYKIALKTNVIESEFVLDLLVSSITNFEDEIIIYYEDRKKQRKIGTFKIKIQGFS